MNYRDSQRPLERGQRQVNSVRPWLAAIALVGVAGCAATGREDDEPNPLPAKSAAALNTPNSSASVYVIATRDKPRIIESLESAEIPMTTNLLEADFMLRVTVGAGQGAQSCGTRHNVRYSLRRDGAPVVELVEKGYLGTCTPNVFDVLSRRLAGALASGDGAQGDPPKP